MVWVGASHALILAFSENTANSLILSGLFPSGFLFGETRVIDHSLGSRFPSKVSRMKEETFQILMLL